MIILAKYSFFMKKFPLCASNFKSKNKLKSPDVIRCFFLALYEMFPIVAQHKALNTSICIFSVFMLNQLIKMCSEPLRHQESKYDLPYLFAVFKW